MDQAPLPETLTLDDAFRAAFYMALQYLEIEKTVNEEAYLYAQYLWSDPAREDDWTVAVRRALADGGLASPTNHQERRWPGAPGTPMEQIN